MPSLPPEPGAAELSDMLVGAVRGVLRAQDDMDEHASRQRLRTVHTPLEEIGLPPIWFTFRNVEIDVDLSARFERTMQGGPTFVCKAADATAVGLFGYEASTGMRVKVQLGPKPLPAVEPPTPDDDEDTD